MNMQTPAEYVASHELTLQLKRLGVTDGQLEAMQFRPNQEGRPFINGRSPGARGTPLTALSLVKAYCALKWLILENSKHSRDKDDAWHLVSATMATPIYRMGISYKETQRLRAKKPRSATCTTRPSITRGRCRRTFLSSSINCTCRSASAGRDTRLWIDGLDGLLGLLAIGAVELHP